MIRRYLHRFSFCKYKSVEKTFRKLRKDVVAGRQALFVLQQEVDMTITMHDKLLEVMDARLKIVGQDKVADTAEEAEAYRPVAPKRAPMTFSHQQRQEG